LLRNKNTNEIFRGLGIQNNFLFNNINKTEKDETKKKTLDKGFIMENNSHLGDSQLSKKDEEKIYHINKKIETIKSNYMTTIGNNNIS
jgi:hypothetical protein